MKSYTDIEQSKKLAEILPPESADMHYNNASTRGINYVDKYRAELMDYNSAQKVLSECLVNPMFEIIPCWSTTALLQILPRYIEYIYWLALGRLDDDSGWYVCYEDDVVNLSIRYYIAKSNLLDACVEMILKLKEEGLL